MQKKLSSLVIMLIIAFALMSITASAGFIMHDPTDDGILNTTDIWVVQQGNVTEGPDGWIVLNDQGTDPILWSKINASGLADDGATNISLSFRVNLSGSSGASGGGFADDGATASTASYHASINNLVTGSRLYYDTGASFVACGASGYFGDGDYIKITYSQADDTWYVFNSTEWDSAVKTQVCSQSGQASGSNFVPQFVMGEGNQLRIADVRLWNESEDVGPPADSTTYFNLTANDSLDSYQLLSFFATINGTNYTTTTGWVATTINQSLGALVNISITSDGYLVTNYIDYNSSNDFTALLDPAFHVRTNDSSNGNSILEFSAIVISTNYSTTNGTITTSLNRSVGAIVNITAITTTGYIIGQYLNYNTSENLTAELDPAFHLKAENTWNSSALNNFTTYINGDTYTTANGLIQTNIAYDNTSLFNITFAAPDNFNVTYNYVNVSTNLTGSLFQTILKIIAYDVVSNSSIPSFSSGINTTSNTTTNGEIVFNPNSGTYSFNVTATGYQDSTGNSLTLSSLDNVTQAIFLNPSVNFSILFESDGTPFNVNATNSTKLTIFCANTTIEHDFNRTVNESSVLLYVDCAWDFIKLDVVQEDSSYFRTYIPDVTDRNVVMYAIDLAAEVAVQVILNLNDLIGDFVDGSAVIKRFVNGTSQTIIQQEWDIENKVNLYLIKNTLYTLSLISSSGTEKNIGDFVADSAGEKTVTVPEIPFIPDSTFGNGIMWDWNDNMSLIKLVYNDTTSQGTSSLNFTVYNGTNLTHVVYATSSTNVNMASYTYIALENQSYLSCFEAYHTAEGYFNDCKQYWAGKPIGGLDAFDSDDAQTYKNWASIFLFVVVILLFKNFVSVGMALDAFIMFFLLKVEWLTFGSAKTNYLILSIWTLLTVIVFIIEASRR